MTPADEANSSESVQDLEDEVRLLQERLGQGGLDPDRVCLATFLGHPAAVALDLGTWTPAGEERDVEAVLASENLEPELLERAAGEAAARVLELGETHSRSGGLRRCVRVALGLELLSDADVEALLEDAYRAAAQDGAVDKRASLAAMACATSARTVLRGPLAGAAAAKTFGLALSARATADRRAEEEWQRDFLGKLLLGQAPDPTHVPATSEADLDDPLAGLPKSKRFRGRLERDLRPSLAAAAEARAAEASTTASPPSPSESSPSEPFVQAIPEPSSSEARSWDSGAEPSSSEARSWDSGAEPSLSEARSWNSGAEPSPSEARSWNSGAEPSPSEAGRPDASQNSQDATYWDAFEDDPFAEAPASGPGWQQNPWVQGGFCVVLALVFFFAGNVPIAAVGALVAVAVMYPLLPKVAELCALVLASCLTAFFVFELLQHLDFGGIINFLLTLVLGWGPWFGFQRL